MQKSVLAGAGFLAALFVVPAFADDTIVDTPYEAPGFTWAGGYVGLQAGYLLGNSHWLDYLNNYADPEPDGFLGGVYAGYNYRLTTNLVLGIDADLTYANAGAFGLAHAPDGTIFGPGVGYTTELNWSGAVRGRFGYSADRFLPYIAGGLAFGDVNYSIIEGSTVTPFTDTMVGWTLGAGLEYAFTDKIIGRFEYRYTDFGSVESGSNGSVIGGKIDLKTNDIRLGIAYKF
ncbi:MAG: porin family protein [Mesorhizobium sp.]|nr:porin family protein [Mesorhizobium sp.]